MDTYCQPQHRPMSTPANALQCRYIMTHHVLDMMCHVLDMTRHIMSNSNYSYLQHDSFPSSFQMNFTWIVRDVFFILTERFRFVALLLQKLSITHLKYFSYLICTIFRYFFSRSYRFRESITLTSTTFVTCFLLQALV